MVSSRDYSRSFAGLLARGEGIAQRIGSAVSRRISRLARTARPVGATVQPHVEDTLEREMFLAASTDAPVLITAQTLAAARYIADIIQERRSDAHSSSFTVIRGSATLDFLVTLLHKGSGAVVFENVGALDDRIQAVLLEFLEHRARYRAGDLRDCRILSTALPDLYSRVQAGTFREALFYRLNTVHINACLPVVTVGARTASPTETAH
jgi:transcriptional regulator of acetoin/glycerol metabolism